MDRRELDLGLGNSLVEFFEDPEKQKQVHTQQKRAQPTGIDDRKYEAIKATFISTGGNLSATASEHHVTTDAVLNMALEGKWPVYGGGTTSIESANRGRLEALHTRLWLKIEKHLDSLEVEEKQKTDIVQHRSMSKYVEPLASRNQTFKMLFDQWMRVGAMLNPEVFGDDPAIGNNNAARRAQETMHPNALGGVQGVNREMADFISQVAVGIADEINRKNEIEVPGEDIIEAEVVEDD